MFDEIESIAGSKTVVGVRGTAGLPRTGLGNQGRLDLLVSPLADFSEKVYEAEVVYIPGIDPKGSQTGVARPESGRTIAGCRWPSVEKVRIATGIATGIETGIATGIETGFTDKRIRVAVIGVGNSK